MDACLHVLKHCWLSLVIMLVIAVSGSSAVRHGGRDHQVQGAATRVPVCQDTQPGMSRHVMADLEYSGLRITWPDVAES